MVEQPALSISARGVSSPTKTQEVCWVRAAARARRTPSGEPTKHPIDGDDSTATSGVFAPIRSPCFIPRPSPTTSGIRFASDSLLEEDGFEPSVPGDKPCSGTFDFFSRTRARARARLKKLSRYKANDQRVSFTAKEAAAVTKRVTASVSTACGRRSVGMAKVEQNACSAYGETAK